MAQNLDVWPALGIQISKALKNRMGMLVPNLGQFGFTPNDQSIFIPVPSFSLKPCIFTEGVLQPYTGTIPTHASINLSRLASDLKSSLDSAKNLLETAIAQFKDKVKSDFKQEIPGVGQLLIKNHCVYTNFYNVNREISVTEDAAQWLSSNLGIELKESRPRTTSQGSKNKPTPSSMRNLQTFRPASVQSEASHSQALHSRSTGNFRSDKAVDSINNNIAKITMMCQARDQTSRGLLSYPEFYSILNSIDACITETQVKRLVAVTNSGSGGKVRYKLFLDSLGREKRVSAPSQASDFTDNYPSQSLAPLSRLIWEKKLVITEISQSSGMRPRLEVQPSEILSVLKKSGVFINIHQLKAILRESEACSVLELLKTARRLSGSEDIIKAAETARPYSSLVSDMGLDKIRAYLNEYNLSEFFTAAGRNGRLHVDDFVSYITEQSFGKVKALDAQQAFFRVSHENETISEADFCKGFCKYENPRQIQDRGVRTLRNWLREEKLSTEQGFEYLLHSSNSSQSINYDNWVKVLRTFGFNLYESSVLFDCIDTKQDRVIDLAEWINKVYEDEGPLQSFKDTVLKYKIDKEDMLIKLNAHSKQRLSVEEMAEALRRMDPTLTLTNAVNMARSAAGSKGYIDVQDFLAQLSQKPEEFQGDWKEQILRKIQNKVKGSVDGLRKILEEADIKNTGKLDLVRFQECIYKADLGLDSIEIERLGRVLDRKSNLTVNYNEFLDNLEGPNLPPQDPLKSTALRLQVFLRQNEISANQLLKKLGAKVSVAKFANFLQRKVQKRFSLELIDEVAEKFDVNKDGFIDINDLTSILTSKSYIELSTGNPYPTRPLSPLRAKSVIKDIRTALVQLKMNFLDAFNSLDSENLGVLSAKQFSEGLAKYIELSEPVKYGLFALIDKLGTGLITYEAFCSVIKDNDLEPKSHKDSWNWEEETIKKIRKWIKAENLSVENAFRAFDVDFDGVISKEDLKIGLITVLKLQTKECPSSKMDRLYKLMDTFKRNSIQLSDFKQLFEENSNPEWKKSAKQQLGLFISKTYSSIKHAYEVVSELTGKIKLEQFIKWVESNQVLSGFNLTQQLLEKLFAELDPHRKAFITEHDWELAFSTISYKDQCIKEIKDAIRSNFSDIRPAFEYFISFHKPQPTTSISLLSFQQGISALLPKRFSLSELQNFYSSLWPTPPVDFLSFSHEFTDIKFLSTFSQTSKRSSSHSTPQSFMSYASTSPKDPLKRLQSLIKASPNNIEEVFKKIDTDESGKLSAVEFRKALRKLSLGLSARDIDMVMSRIDTNNDGQIDWQEFQKNFKTSDTEKFTNGVAQSRIQKMRQNMHAYMLSPKDAFLQFDPDRIGTLDFNKFTALINRLSELSGEAVPAFTVIKDLFDIIDIRKDGILDLREWLNTFTGEVKTWEDSKDFDEISKIIARNRKLLLITFDAMSKNGRIELQKAKEILSSITRHMKITDEVWTKILRVALKEGGVDYRFLLDIYKDRALMKQWHPKASS